MGGNKFVILAALLIAGGLGIAGYFAGKGFKEGRAAERFVTVKGVSERDVEADTAIWSLTLVSTDNDLASAASATRVRASSKSFRATRPGPTWKACRPLNSRRPCASCPPSSFI